MTGPQQISAGIDEVKENADRLGLTWTLRPGTIAAPTTAGSNACAVTMDGDSSPIPAFSMAGDVAAGFRVYVLRVQPEGTYIAGIIGPQKGVAAVRVVVTTNQDYTNGVVFAIPWQAAEYDTHGFWDSGTPNQLMIPFDGLYTFTCFQAWNATAGLGVRYLALDKNGVNKARHRHPAIAADNMELGMPDEFECAAGDIIKLFNFQTSGGTLGSATASLTARYVGSV